MSACFSSLCEKVNRAVIQPANYALSTFYACFFGRQVSKKTMTSTDLSRFLDLLPDRLKTANSQQLKEIKRTLKSVENSLESSLLPKINAAFIQLAFVQKKIFLQSNEQSCELKLSEQLSKNATDKFFGLCLTLIREEDSIAALKEEMAK